MRVPLLVVVGLVLSGCAGPGGASGLNAIADAAAVAQAWNPEARLVQILGIESVDGKVMSVPGYPELDAIQTALVPSRDSVPGDGKAPAWLYRYQSDDAALLVVFAADGGKRLEQEVAYGASFGPLGVAEVDSTRAAGVAMANRTFAEASASGTAMQLIATRSGTTAWQLVAGTAIVYVDATTATIIPAKVAEQPPAPLMRVAGITGGTLTAGSDPAQDAFSIPQSGHAEMTVVLVLTRPLANNVTLDIAHPDGKATQIQGSASDVTEERSEHAVVLGEPPAGAYQLTTTLNLGVFQAYSIHWCSDGLAVVQDDANEACRLRGD